MLRRVCVMVVVIVLIGHGHRVDRRVCRHMGKAHGTTGEPHSRVHRERMLMVVVWVMLLLRLLLLMMM